MTTISNQYVQPVLDHGFVILRNLAGPTRRTQQSSDWGNPIGTRPFDADDTDVANSARMSFEGQDKDRTYETEMKLNRYLLENRHMTPFESIEVWLEMKLPIFVARQFVRHRTTSLNEVSARYVQLPKEWYIPKIEHVLMQQEKKKQGGRPVNLEELTERAVAEKFLEALDVTCRRAYEQYEWATELGVAMEQARMFLHVNHYTHWLWKQDLRNLLHFLSLRDHSHAQWEARQYAEAIVILLSFHLPGLMKLYQQLVRQA